MVNPGVGLDTQSGILVSLLQYITSHLVIIILRSVHSSSRDWCVACLLQSPVHCEHRGEKLYLHLPQPAADSGDRTLHLQRG